MTRDSTYWFDVKFRVKLARAMRDQANIMQHLTDGLSATAEFISEMTLKDWHKMHRLRIDIFDKDFYETYSLIDRDRFEWLKEQKYGPRLTKAQKALYQLTWG